MASKAGICVVLDPVIFTSFCHQFNPGQILNVIDGYVFLPSIGFNYLFCKLKLRLLRKLCNAIQTFKESLFRFLNSRYIMYKYDLHCALKSMLRDQYALQGSREFERFFPATSDSVKTNAYRSNLNVIFCRVV